MEWKAKQLNRPGNDRAFQETGPSGWGPFLERPGKLSGLVYVIPPVSHPKSHQVSPFKTFRMFFEAPVIYDPVNIAGNLRGNLREVVVKLARSHRTKIRDFKKPRRRRRGQRRLKSDFIF